MKNISGLLIQRAKIIQQRAENVKRVYGSIEALDGRVVDAYRIAKFLHLPPKRVKVYLKQLLKEKKVVLHKVGRKRYYGVK